MVVTLVGYRGCGKTSVARPLAERLGGEWIDADDEIERRAGRSIAEIFATDGEPEFRRWERETIAELLGRESLVLAAGGGAVLDERTRAAMRAAGPVVWLRAPVATLAERIATDGSTGDRRPSLSGGDVLAEIGPILAAREPVYRESASLVVETEGRSPEDIAEEIATAVRADDDGGRDR